MCWVIDTLAAAYAEIGDFPEAIRCQKIAVEKTTNAGRVAYVSRLKLFLEGKTMRDPNA